MKKNYLLKTKTLQVLRSLSLLLGLVLLGFAYSGRISAQGTAGNMITFNANNSTLLYSDLGTSNTQHASYSCYLRHNQAPIQIINANPMATGNEVAALQSVTGTGTGFFANSNLANNMAFSTGGDYGVDFYNYASKYNTICFAIIAPKGYRFTEYWMSICSNKYTYSKIQRDNGSKGATIMRYNYNEGSRYLYTPCEGESMTLSSDGSDEEIFSHTLSNAGNILYFRIYYGSTAEWATHMNELRLKYVIDDDFTATIPGDEGTNQVHTGYINLGSLTSKTNAGDYFFNKTNVTDLEDVNIVSENTSSTMSVSNGSILLSEGGTYWIEAPSKFRILGANVNFSSATASSETTYGEASTTFTSGKTYLIGDGNGNYLSLNSNGNAVNQGTQSSATKWNITQTSSENYTIQNSDGDYLYYNSGTISKRSDSYEWRYNTTNRFFYYYNSSNSRSYSFYLSNNPWSASRRSHTTLYFYEVIESSTYSADNYTATVYNATNTGEEGTVTINSSEGQTSGSVELKDLNNDGIKFSVSGPAAFTVDLTLLPLDPNLQTLEFGHKLSDGTTDGTDFVSTNATDFQFNGGETIVIPLSQELQSDGETYGDNGNSHTIIFRNAYNENRTPWYDGTGSGEKVSNYYLVDSEYEKNNTATTAPDDKVNADKAGTTKVEFSNIKTLTANGGTLQETAFNKTDANYQTITLTDGAAAQTIYIYSADHPVNMIMTNAGKAMNTHVAYTFYEAKIQTQDIEEEPVIEVTELYTSSLKGENKKAPIYNTAMNADVSVPKDGELDNTHHFYGVKVTSQLKAGSAGTQAQGYLNNVDIINAIKSKMTETAYSSSVYDGDVMRTILYVDMSELKSVAGNPETWKELMLGTADNCLFFMPAGFDISQEMPGGGIIAGGEAGVAVTDITVVDQQPFYTPHSFYTSTYVAHYERNAENGRMLANNTTLVLPFSVLLSSDGHLLTTSDNVDERVQYFNLSNDLKKPTEGYVDYQISPVAVTAGEATACIPYHVVTSEQTETTGYVIEVKGARFPVTPEAASISNHYNNSETIAYGSFNGVQKSKDPGFYYFTENYFVNSSTLPEGVDVKILPYRAWYEISSPDFSDVKRFTLDFDSDTVTGIMEINDTPMVKGIYDLTGRHITTDNLNTLPKGLYIVNGKKIFIK